MLGRRFSIAAVLALALRLLVLVDPGTWNVLVDAVPINQQAKEECETVRNVLKFAQTKEFVQAQFDSWMGATDCPGFVDSFVEPFEYCDATPTCLTHKSDLLALCQKMAGLAGTVYDLQIKPSWSPLPNFTSIVATGRQNLDLGPLKGALCFDFAIVQDFQLLPTNQELKSHSWRGYYNILPLGCGFWQNVRARVGRMIPRRRRRRKATRHEL